MLNQDQIKKLVEVCEPEGLRFSTRGSDCYIEIWDTTQGEPDHKNNCGWDSYLIDFTWSPYRDIAYPLFLQRCIEGVNRKYQSVSDNETKWISVEGDCICVSLNWRENDKNFFYKDHDTIDQAKEAALLYYLQEVEG